MNLDKLCAELSKTNDVFTVADIRAAAARVEESETSPKSDGKNDGAPKSKTAFDVVNEDPAE